MSRDLIARLEAIEAEAASLRAELAKAQEPTPWKPKENRFYYFSSDSGELRMSIWDGGSLDQGRLAFGNVQPTLKAAELHAKRIRSMVPTCPVPKVGDECWWVNNDFHAFSDKWVNGTADREMYLGGRVFATEEAAKAWISEFADAWTTLEDAS